MSSPADPVDPESDDGDDAEVVRISLADVHVLGREEGEWCPKCARSSAVRVRVAVVDPSTLRILGRAEPVVCADCTWTR